MKNLYVINSKKEKEPFSLKKIIRSAKRVGASKDLAEEIAKIIQREAYPGIKTLDIFKKIKKLLSKEKPSAALKFNLKEAMRKLGPTGFPFEKYIGQIFKKLGYKVKLNQHVFGICCDYEIDFLAQKDNLLYIGECKYRNLAGEKVDSKVALYNYARFLDLKKAKCFKNLKIKSLLVTNTKFTTKAIKYSNCTGVELLGWNYPENKGLEYLIDKEKLYPITILPSLKKYIADIFVTKKIMLIQDILDINLQKFSKEVKIPIESLNPLIKEAKILLKSD